VTAHAAERYRQRVDPTLEFGEARERLLQIAAAAEPSANAPLWLDHLAAAKGLRFLVAAGLRGGCGLVRGDTIVTVLTPEFPYDESHEIEIRRPKRKDAEHFNQRMWASYRDAEEQGYEATSTLLKMVKNLGAVQAAKQLLHEPGWEDPLQRLREVGALDLSIEAHVLSPRYSHLFSSEELEEARRRLAHLESLDF
jgi:hypothetical protein